MPLKDDSKFYRPELAEENNQKEVDWDKVRVKYRDPSWSPIDYERLEFYFGKLSGYERHLAEKSCKTTEEAIEAIKKYRLENARLNDIIQNDGGY